MRMLGVRFGDESLVDGMLSGWVLGRRVVSN